MLLRPAAKSRSRRWGRNQPVVAERRTRFRTAGSTKSREARSLTIIRGVPCISICA